MSVKRAAALLLVLALVLLGAPPPSTGRAPSTPAPIREWTAYPSTAPEVQSEAPTPTASAFATRRPAPTVAGSATPGASVSGIASWYCRAGVSRCTRGHPDGMYAAIRRDLLFLRGRLVTVCAERCIVVTIIDCNCGPSANLIDLYSDAFRELAPLSRGVVRVTVSW